jgi:hexosaminidase
MRFAVVVAVMSLGMASAMAQARPSDPPLLPMPASVTTGVGSFVLDGARVAARSPGEQAAARRLQALLARSGGPKLDSGRDGRIRFRHSRSVGGAEAYRIRVSPREVEVVASSDAGLFYGAETLWQLIASSKQPGRIPSLVIDDRPAFSWRGLMLDSARHFQPVSYVEQLIDRMALAKLNRLHWHLSDDQGWRVEIDRYPRLTSVGAWRQPAGAAGVDPATGEPVVYGGYYSKADIRAVVAYARERHVMIVPEIDVPGHATAMIAAYPELASTPRPPRAPSHDWGILPNLLNPDDSTFTFLGNVLDEVMELFPGPYIHMGGDEAVKDQWNSNPAVQAKIRALGLKDADALQGWFTARIADYLAQHRRRLIGWDEIQQGQIQSNAVVMSWHGTDGALAAAQAGHDAILAASPILYLDHIQSDSGDEPPGRGEIINWRQLYQFEPVPPIVSASSRRHILGLQGNLWTEHVRTTAYADRMIWPRAAIIAELAWSDPAKDWPAFSKRLAAATNRWRMLGLDYNAVPLEAEASFSRSGNGVAVSLRQPADSGTLRYALDGAPLTAASPAYTGPLVLASGTRIAAQAFLGSAPLAKAKEWQIAPELLRTRSASEMELCSNAIPLRLEDDGPTAGVRKVHWADIMHPCWIWRGAPLDGARRVVAQVGRLPFNFSIGEDIKKISFDRPATAAGELHVRRDGCDGPIIATVPLESATKTAGVAEVTAELAASPGAHDLCMTFAQQGPDPFWVLDRLTLQ